MCSIERFYVYDYSLLCIHLSDSTCSLQRLYAYASATLRVRFSISNIQFRRSMCTFGRFYAYISHILPYVSRTLCIQDLSGKEARSTFDKQQYSIGDTTPQRDIAEYRQCPRLLWCERQPSFITLMVDVVFRWNSEKPLALFQIIFYSERKCSK